jgi:hypothetical protein
LLPVYKDIGFAPDAIIGELANLFGRHSIQSRTVRFDHRNKILFKLAEMVAGPDIFNRT